MYKVKQLYVVFDDDSGHKYLIPKDEYGAFEKCLSRIEESYSEHKDEDIYYDELNDILDALSDQRLEGERVYVVLPNDLIKEIKMKHKFLITNDVGLALDKVNVVLSTMRSDSFLQNVEVTDEYYDLDDLLVETLAHLDQALTNLGEED